MTHYDYKVVPAPKRAKRVKGVHAVEELFALTLTDTINEVARQGWEYVRAEHLPAESPGGWFRGSTSGEQTVLVFRRAREQLGPRLAAVRPEPADLGPEVGPVLGPVPVAERAVIDRLRREPVRLEPRIDDDAEFTATPLRPGPRIGASEDFAATPLRPGPRLGPAEP